MSMNNLDLLIKENSPTQQEYEDNKELIKMHLKNEIDYQSLPQGIKDILWEWEFDVIETNRFISQSTWEDSDG